MLANIKNGQTANRDFILQNQKKICERVLNILWKENYIIGYSKNRTKNNTYKIALKYQKDKPAIKNIKLISKPSKRTYYSSKQIWKINSNKYFIIFSTNKGLQSLNDCKNLNIGGQPIITIR